MKWLILLLLLPLGSRGQIITLFAGTGSTVYSGNGTPAISAGIPDPIGGVFDKSGNYYFADLGSERIRKIDLTGIIITVAGNGMSGFAGDSGPATAAKLNSPEAVALDTFGNLYIADAGNERIRKVTISTGIITTIVGTGTGGYSGDGGAATAAEIWDPWDVCVDIFGNLYIGDIINNRVRKVNVSGIITTFAGTGSTGFSGDGGAATSSNINAPTGIASDNTGNIYIADNSLGRVRKVNLAGIISTVAGDGSFSYSGDDIPATSAQIAPLKIAVDSFGDLFIADEYNFRVYKVDTVGIIHNVAGNGVETSSGDGGSSTAASFCQPTGVAIDACGNLFITDGGKVSVPICTGYDIRKVTFNSIGLPSIAITANPGDTVCTGTSVTYNAAVTSGTPISYQWYVNGATTGSTNSTYTYTPASGDFISCVLVGVSQCSGDTATVSSNTIYMVVTTPTTPTITLAATTPALVGSTVTVNATVANAGSSYSINWYDNGVLFNTTTVPVVTYIKDTGMDNIAATVIPAAGCYDSTASSIFSIGATTGISNIKVQPLNIYPNPMHGVIYVDGDVVKYSMCDIVGAVQQQGMLHTGHNTIAMPSLATGMYMLEVTDAAGAKVVKKVVKE